MLSRFKYDTLRVLDSTTAQEGKPGVRGEAEMGQAKMFAVSSELNIRDVRFRDEK